VPRAPLPPELERFLEKPRKAVVATVTEAGAPVSTATWYEWVDGRVVLTMDASGHRIRNLRRDPRVALTVLGDTWYNHVSLLGRMAEEHPDQDYAVIDRLSQRYEGEPYPDRDFECIYVLVEVDRWHTWGDPASEVG
jgi:PPOX class probable F420-dependent enzyme